ncbi:MAG: Mur ligase family protein [Dysosmobacter sp.]
MTTNLAPNHLDVHKDYQEYVDAKANIFTHQTAGDIAVFNADNDDTVRQAAKAVGEVRWFSRKQRVDNGVFCENGVIYEAANGTVTPIMETKDVLLPGVHNIENYMAAFAAVRGMVSYETMREIAKTFGGVEHRIELIQAPGKASGGTTIPSRPAPAAPSPGLNSFPEQVILIAGGKDKGISYAPLGPVVNDHVKLLLLCGKTAGCDPGGRVEQAENYHGLEITRRGGLPRGGGHCRCPLPAGGRGDPVPGQHLLLTASPTSWSGARCSRPSSTN